MPKFLPHGTLKRRAADVLAYFDRPGTSNGPTEAINGRLEHLRGSALCFRHLTNYVARSLLESGASDRNYTFNSEEPVIGSSSTVKLCIWIIFGFAVR